MKSFEDRCDEEKRKNRLLKEMLAERAQQIELLGNNVRELQEWQREQMERLGLDLCEPQWVFMCDGIELLHSSSKQFWQVKVSRDMRALVLRGPAESEELQQLPAACFEMLGLGAFAWGPCKAFIDDVLSTGCDGQLRTGMVKLNEIVEMNTNECTLSICYRKQPAGTCTLSLDASTPAIAARW